MAGWKKAMHYLGLGPDEAYEQFDDGYAQDGPRPNPQQAPARPAPSPAAQPEAAVRAIRPVPVEPVSETGVSAVRPVSAAPAAPSTEIGTVRAVPMSAAVKPHTISPTSFNDAQAVADRFMVKQPVIVNLQGVDRDLSRRLIDFASGICYVLDGSMEKIASQVFLLIPESVEVSDEDRRRIEERGYAR